MNLLSSKPRAEGETAFPAVATIEEAVRGVIRARRPPAEQEAIEKENARIKHFNEHPELYLSKEEVVEFREKVLAMCNKAAM